MQFYYVFTPFFLVFRTVSGPVRTEKYHKIRKSEEKQSTFSTVFSRQQGNKTTSLQGKISQGRKERRECMIIEDI